MILLPMNASSMGISSHYLVMWCPQCFATDSWHCPEAVVVGKIGVGIELRRVQKIKEWSSYKRLSPHIMSQSYLVFFYTQCMTPPSRPHHLDNHSNMLLQHYTTFCPSHKRRYGHDVSNILLCGGQLPLEDLLSLMVFQLLEG